MRLPSLLKIVGFTSINSIQMINVLLVGGRMSGSSFSAHSEVFPLYFFSVPVTCSDFVDFLPLYLAARLVVLEYSV